MDEDWAVHDDHLSALKQAINKIQSQEMPPPSKYSCGQAKPLIQYLSKECIYGHIFFRFLFQFAKYLKNTPPKFFPWEIGNAKIFGQKNSKIRVQNGSKWANMIKNLCLCWSSVWKQSESIKKSPQYIWRGLLMWVGPWQLHYGVESLLAHSNRHSSLITYWWWLLAWPKFNISEYLLVYTKCSQILQIGFFLFITKYIIFGAAPKILYFVIDQKNPICKILAIFCIYQEIFRNIKFWSCQEPLPKGYKAGMPVGVCQQGSHAVVLATCVDVSLLRHIMSHQAWVYAQFGSMFRIFFRENRSIACFETWWTGSSPWKEAIALFFVFLLALFGVSAKISGTISLYRHFLDNGSWTWLEFVQELPSIYLRPFRSLFGHQ